ncbi:MAG TPA: bifunctional UDP-sugar hydrolase/5'-nucleotidase, partial [Bacteroidales bacterium]|nr:bifunctional UDP-sugar hydrolase/5'-nucleotidase [Bacteroidales bacterium]
MKKRTTLILSGFLLCLIGFSQITPGKTGEIIILHTNDMHAKIDNLAKLAFLADSLKKTHPYVFLVASGDNFTGNPVVDKIRDIGYPMIDLMNRCGFNVSAIGNHEFDMGQELMNKRIEQARFPFISCNIDAKTAVLKQPEPFVVLKAGDLATLAFLSAIELNESGIPDTHPSKVKGIVFTNGIQKAQEFKWLKEKYGILIGVTHLGVEDDIMLAGVMPQFDVIMGGHSHTLIDTALIVNGVRITQAGANLAYIGKTTLEIENGKVKNIRDEMIRVSSLKNSDPDILKLIEKYNDVKEFSKIVGTAAKPVEGYDQLGSLMTDAVREKTKSDFAFQNIGGIRVRSIDAGDISLKDIYRLDPFGNKVVVMSMTAKEIESLICYGFNLEKVPDLQVSGMNYTVFTDKNGRCSRVEMKYNHPDQPGILYDLDP